MYTAKEFSPVVAAVVFMISGLGAASDVAAVTVWDERLDGDLTNFSGPSATHLGVLDIGANTIIGSLDAGPLIPDEGPGAIAMNGPDEHDTFNFIAFAPWTLEFVSLSGLPVLHFGVHGGRPAENPVLATSFDPDVFDGLLAAGSYGIYMLPPNNTGVIDYQVKVNVIPLPAAAWLFASALGMVGYLGHRKASDQPTGASHWRSP